ncbi:MAG: hypothetical protein LBM93_05680 [Oscillospiraceae bacterium]|nr:hypothetical protein [Oscillospiraceae bacterium]
MEIFMICFAIFFCISIAGFTIYVFYELKKAYDNCLKFPFYQLTGEGKSSEKRISEFTKKFKDISFPNEILKDYEISLSLTNDLFVVR